MKNRLYFRVLLLSLISMTVLSANAATKVPMIGLDDNGKEVVKKIGRKDFEKRFTNVVDSFQNSLLQSLEDNDKALGDWEMKKIYAGASLSASIGLGSIIKASAAPSFYLIIKK